MRTVLPPILFGMLLGGIASGARAAEPRVSDIAVIPIHDGVNRIERFAADGRPATIVRGRRDNGNARGHSVHLVLLPTKEGTGEKIPRGSSRSAAASERPPMFFTS